MTNKTLSQTEAITFGWNTYRRHLPFLICLLFVSLIVTGAPALLARKIEFSATPYSYWSLRILQGVGALVESFIWILVSLRLHDQDKIELKEIFNQTALFPNFMATAILYLSIALGPALV